jgi:Tfp pilus assembly protein PilF
LSKRSKKHSNLKLVAAAVLAAMVMAGLAFAAKPPAALELRGRVTGSLLGRVRPLQVTLFSVDTPYTASTITDPGGTFRFRSLVSGTYTVAVRRRSIGEVRRTVVISASLADPKGAVHVTVPFIASEAAGKNGGTVSAKQLTVPERAWKKYADAQKRLEKHDVDGARQILADAVEQTPQFTAALNSLGVIAYQTRDYPKAEEYFRQAHAAEPDAFEPTVNLGGVLLHQGRLQEALEYNQQAWQARPKDALANVQVGLTYYRLGDFERAEPALAAAKQTDPSHFSRPQLFLASIYQKWGDRRAAARELRDCIARHPDAPDVAALRRRLQDLEVAQAPGLRSEP